MNIRPGNTTDVTQIRHLVSHAIHNSYQYPASAKRKEASYCTAQVVEDSINERLCVVSELDGEILGVCFGCSEDGPVWLNWIVVDPERQNKGLGEILLREFIGYARASGASKIWCSVLINNTASNRLFTTLSFEKVTTLINHWHGLDFNFYQKFL